MRISAQTLGGNSVFSFVNLPATTQLTALGGINISQPSNDVGLAFYNPGLLRAAMHSQLNVVFNDHYAGITSYHLSLGYHNQKINTNFLFGIQYFNYGEITATDASGNISGSLKPTDWVMQVAASHQYREKWNAGLALKYINSNYGQYRSNGIATDLGVVYSDTAKLFHASILARNMGFQLKKYAGTLAADMPFDLQVGLTKRLSKAPFSFSITAHHLHRFDLLYNDTAFNNENGFDNGRERGFTIDKLFRHFVFATTIHIGEKLEVQAGYNYLRRKELNIGNNANGLTGFSLGIGVLLGKMDIRYARTHFQNNTGYNQLGLNMTLNRLFGLGKFGEKIGW